MCRLLFLWLILMSVAFAGAVTSAGEITVDAEEWRDQPVRHLYIHGTWNRTTTFRICMPAPAAWKRRLLQFLEGSMGGRETAGDFGYALSRGAVYVESS